ncbi:MAG: hypothetical protein E7627_02955 [Ruminococcaceae bacterium]|nr:hypothetical protein [Oscillospiraceae bacterium]
MAELLEYKCPCCGGAIGFDSRSQNLKCPYCDTEFDIDTLKHYDEDLITSTPTEEDTEWESSDNQWSDEEQDGFRVYSCDSCGGEIVAEETTSATSCPYCGNPVVMKEQLSGVLKPDYVIPFKLDKKAAKAGLLKHLSGKPLLPKIFKDENHIDEIKGMYVPFWLFDADADANIRYKATRVRSWSDTNYIYTETQYYSVVRGGDIGFERVPVDGSSKMPDDLMQSIEPYDFSEAVDFKTAYLAGFLADKYDITADESAKQANARMKRSTEIKFADTVYGYASVVPESSNVKIHNGQAKYALYPVWILNTTWKDKKYIFAMNGQTGKFVGDLPIDKKAAFLWFLGLTPVCSIAAYAVSLLLRFLGFI